MRSRAALFAVLLLAVAGHAGAQQRPLVTEDPETIGAGRVLLEAGIDGAHDVTYTVSGLRGDLWRLPTIGISVGVSSIAEVQIDGSLHDVLSISSRDPFAPLAGMVTEAGDTTHDIGDATVGMKIRVVPEGPGRPAFAIRFATKLPNASNESGLGTDTMDFFGSILAAKTVQSVRLVGNIGFGILSDPTDGNRQNDVLTYGVSFARAFTQQTEIVGEINGRVSVRSGEAFPGTETRGLLKLGGRYTFGAWRLDGGVYFGLTSIDPTVGFTAGVTYVFNAFTLP